MRYTADENNAGEVRIPHYYLRYISDVNNASEQEAEKEMSARMNVYRRIAVFVAVMIAMPFVTPASYAASMYMDDLGTVTSVIVGRNNKGPYSLDWNNIDPDSLSAVINGRSLKNGKDFRVDASKGMIAFDSVLVNDAIVRVSYRTVPGKSEKSGSQFNLPLQINLFQRENATVQLMGMFLQDDPNNPDAGKTLAGVGANRNWGKTKFTSMFITSQRNGDASENADFMGRSALKFGGETEVGGVKFLASYLHAGNEFGGGKEYGTGQGRETMDFSATYAPGGNFGFSTKFQESKDTAGKTQGNYSSINEQKMDYQFSGSTAIALTHSATESGTAAANSNRSVDSSQLRLTQKLGSKTNAVATIEDAKLMTGSVEDHVRASQLAITSNPIPKVSLQTMLTQKDSERTGQEQSLLFGASYQASTQLKADVGFGSLSNETVGNQTTTSAAVTYSPIQQVAVQASVTDVNSSKLGDSTKTNVVVKANPMRNVEVNGSLVGSALNQSQQFQRNLSVSSKPVDSVKVTAMMSQNGLNTNDDVTKGATLELTPLASTKFETGYRYVETGARTMTIADYGATSKLWSFLSVIGRFRDRELNDSNALDTTTVEIALAPKNYISITGNYRYNPEDDKGNVQANKSSTLGMQTKVGSVAITTNYTTRDEYMASTMYDEQRFGLDLPVFGHGQLNTGYIISRQLNGSAFADKTYSLGYKHNIGSDFSMSLTGNYIQHLKDKLVMPDKTEYTTELSFGIKF